MFPFSVASNPVDLETLFERARKSASNKDWPQAYQRLKRLTAIEPDHSEAQYLLGVAALKVKRFSCAVRAFRRRLSQNASDATAWYYLGMAYYRVGLAEKAVRCCDNAIRLDPELRRAWSLKANAMMRSGDLAAAEALCREALAKFPEEPNLEFPLGIMLLAQGKWEEGWKFYESRQRIVETDWSLFRAERWEGQDLDGKTILILSEQGIGDTIQFLRFAQVLKSQYRCTVWMFCRSTLLPLLEGTAGVDRWVGNRTPPPAL